MCAFWLVVYFVLLSKTLCLAVEIGPLISIVLLSQLAHFQDAKSGWTPLFHAVTNQDAEHVQMLLLGGAQVNLQSYSGNTALHVATGRGYTEIVRLLMRYGADMSLRNTYKDTAVMVAPDNNVGALFCFISDNESKDYVKIIVRVRVYPGVSGSHSRLPYSQPSSG